jgi:hypothetical protein
MTRSLELVLEFCQLDGRSKFQTPLVAGEGNERVPERLNHQRS